MVRALIVALGVVVFATTAYAQTDVQAQIDALLQQIAALQAQLASASAGTSAGTPAVGSAPSTLSCPDFSRTLSLGDSGADVADLQKVLQSGGYLTAAPTGYFGPLTQAALQRFQAKANLVSSGSPQTTGYGVFGPKTRAFLSKICADQLQAKITSPLVSNTPTCPAVSTAEPHATCLGAWQKTQDANGCAAWQCFSASSPNTINKPPEITGVDGSVALFVNQTGAWNVIANDPEGGALQYGVIWGDEGSSNILSVLAGYSKPAFGSSAKLSHAYNTVGRYSAEIDVRDPAGNIAVSTLSITVSAQSASSSSTSLGSTSALPTQPTSNSCLFAGAYYPEGTVTEGHSLGDLCLATGGVCQPSSVYTPKYKCVTGAWESALVNPYPNLPLYGNIVGSSCSNNNSTMQVVVAPNTQICRALLCAIAQNYAPISLNCQYTNWVDWGVFQNAATTTNVCGDTAPCEYVFGSSGRACAPKQNGVCQVPTNSNNPLHY